MRCSFIFLSVIVCSRDRNHLVLWFLNSIKPPNFFYFSCEFILTKINRILFTSLVLVILLNSLSFSVSTSQRRTSLLLEVFGSSTGQTEKQHKFLTEDLLPWQRTRTMPRRWGSCWRRIARSSTRDYDNGTPLHMALLHGWVVVAKCLYKFGADVNPALHKRGWRTPVSSGSGGCGSLGWSCCRMSMPDADE